MDELNFFFGLLAIGLIIFAIWLVRFVINYLPRKKESISREMRKSFDESRSICRKEAERSSNEESYFRTRKD